MSFKATVSVQSRCLTYGTRLALGPPTLAAKRLIVSIGKNSINC